MKHREGYWKCGQGLRETFLSWKQHQCNFDIFRAAFCSLSVHPKLAFSAAHVESWSAPGRPMIMTSKTQGHGFSQLWTACSDKCLPQCWKLPFRKKHTYFCKVLVYTWLPNATLVSLSLCMSIRVYPVSPAKGGDKASMSKMKQNVQKIYESLQLPQRSCKIESNRMLIYCEIDM